MGVTPCRHAKLLQPFHALCALTQTPPNSTDGCDSNWHLCRNCCGQLLLGMEPNVSLHEKSMLGMPHYYWLLSGAHCTHFGIANSTIVITTTIITRHTSGNRTKYCSGPTVPQAGEGTQSLV